MNNRTTSEGNYMICPSLFFVLFETYCVKILCQAWHKDDKKRIKINV
jgi:hypothetical protein